MASTTSGWVCMTDLNISFEYLFMNVLWCGAVAVCTGSRRHVSGQTLQEFIAVSPAAAGERAPPPPCDTTCVHAPPLTPVFTRRP